MEHSTPPKLQTSAEYLCPMKQKQSKYLRHISAVIANQNTLRSLQPLALMEASQDLETKASGLGWQGLPPAGLAVILTTKPLEISLSDLMGKIKTEMDK